MPFEIVRNDICNMQVDAIVNTTGSTPHIGYGVDSGIHEKAGKKLFKARKKLGIIPVGDAAITPGFELSASYVIHTAGPIWEGGKNGEEKLLSDCYKNSLRLALENGCESIAFPLLSAGNHGFPKPLALQIAINAFSEFLLSCDMHIYLVVFSKSAVTLSEKLFDSIQSYIDENYVEDKILDEYGVADKCEVREATLSRLRSSMRARREEVLEDRTMSPMPPLAPKTLSSESSKEDIEKLLDKLDDGFSPTLLRLIDKTGKKDSEIYKRANIDRKLFSKIRNNPEYKPSKATALAFAIALELSLEETRDFIAKAGFTLSHSSKFDVIIEYFISNKKYDMFEINETLFAFDQSLLGA